MDSNLEELYLNNVWRPQLAITGGDGIPAVKDAKNVVRKSTTFKVSLRIPPSAIPKEVNSTIVKVLQHDIPYAAHLTLSEPSTGSGWLAKDWQTGDKLKALIDTTAQTYFKAQTEEFGEGGSIPFLKELELKFPETRIVAVGVLGPGSNAHSKNENLELEYSRKLICAIADIFKGFSA